VSRGEAAEPNAAFDGGAPTISAMLVLRSLAFNLAYYLNLLLWLVGLLPTLVLPRRVLVAAVRVWARSNLALLRLICGIDVEVRGASNIPQGGLIVAAKHQSVWETFALSLFFEDPCYIMKRELMWIPFFGWYCAKGRMIAINRGARSAALRGMIASARAELAAERQILIFPEGTRRPPGAPPAYKFGVSFLYEQGGVPCLPIALNSGLFWPRRQMIRRPGTIVLDIRPPIPPGLPRATAFARMQEEIEAGSQALLAESRARQRARPTKALA